MRLNRRYEQQEEFRTRQGRFDFAEVAQFVVDIALQVRSSFTNWMKKTFIKVAETMTAKPVQLALAFSTPGNHLA